MPIVMSEGDALIEPGAKTPVHFVTVISEKHTGPDVSMRKSESFSAFVNLASGKA